MNLLTFSCRLLSSTVVDLEALACHRAVMYIAKNDLHNVIFEGDSTSVINAISQESTLLTSFGNIVGDIRALVLVFQFFQFVHVHRTCNVVADALAKKAKSLVGS